MSPVAAPADRRFRRAHVKPAHRKRGWRRAGPLAAGFGVAAIALALVVVKGSTAFAHAHVLPIGHIVVRGNERLSKGEVLAVLGGLRGESLLWADLGVWRRRLLASPWVRDAALRRSLPSTVEVAISERQPVGIGRINGDMYLIDDTGAVIDQYGPQYADLDLPIVDGLAADPGNGSLTDPARAEFAARVIASIRAKSDVARRLSQLDVGDLHDATVILNGDPAVLHLGDDQFLQRLQSYLDLSATLHDQVANIDYVDLRFDDRIYVRPAEKPGTGGGRR